MMTGDKGCGAITRRELKARRFYEKAKTVLHALAQERLQDLALEVSRAAEESVFALRHWKTLRQLAINKRDRADKISHLKKPIRQQIHSMSCRPS